MLRSTTEENRLYLTADLRALDGKPLQKRQISSGSIFPAGLKRFPPVEDVVVALDRIASRAFAA
ncbi:MAG: hypothetical protein V4720_04290 [Pseudomonadota bacterium]|uniref:hypothetical protein n=1 Tax=Tabrizicola sp. TaxID=2005166 RepID=UPI0025EC5424|nr:hypothetical protein [Tabrizicola sp.]